jgi:hypothetical protein
MMGFPNESKEKPANRPAGRIFPVAEISRGQDQVHMFIYLSLHLYLTNMQHYIESTLLDNMSTKASLDKPTIRVIKVSGECAVDRMKMGRDG